MIFSSSEDRQAGPVEGLLHAVLRPFQQSVTAIRSRVTGVWRDYVALVGVREENRRLKEETKRLRQERSVLLGYERENRRLKKFLNLKAQYEFPSLLAQVIGEDAIGWYKVYFINRGSEDGIAPGMAATVAEGVVGRVAGTTPSISKVLLVTDPGVAIDCRVARTRDRGVLSGYLDKECILRYMDLRSQVKAGDEVVTSGLDGVFPKGLPVGTVKQVRRDAQGLFLEALVTPAVNLSEIEEVLVVLGKRGGYDIQPGLEGKR
ncbi:MAG: rod shape-determining protein MreC [Desulfomonile sp.]|nr:rod shape-determining protein MreC [Desulfomonile sp.]